MSGPKLRPRPPDFDEVHVQRSPTFRKWRQLSPGSTLVYACRTFTKGGVDEEERLMRRIMIAHRNNLKEHAVLKRAMREADASRAVEGEAVAVEAVGKSSSRRRRRGTCSTTTVKTGGDQNDVDNDDDVREGTTKIAHATSASSPVPPASTSSRPPPGRDDDDAPSSGTASGGVVKRSRRTYGESAPPKSDEDVLREMDVDAVEMTRSYRRWMECPHGTSFTYNHTYVRGMEGHDWLLRKNIWRRMKYRRENRVKVLNLMAREIDDGGTGDGSGTNADSGGRGGRGRQKREEDDDHDDGDDHHQRLLVVSRAVEDAAAAAAARADSYDHAIDAEAVAALGAGGEEDDPSAELSGVLDAAARLAAAVSVADGAVHVKSEEANGGI